MGKKERVNRSYPLEFKVQVCKEYYTTNLSLHELAEKYEIYPQMIVRWRKAYVDHPDLKGLKKTQLAKGSRKPVKKIVKTKSTKSTKHTKGKKTKKKLLTAKSQ